MADSQHDWSDIAAMLSGYVCLWQDLDGVHVTSAPKDPPLTSIIWAWPSAMSCSASLPKPHTEEEAREGEVVRWSWLSTAEDFAPPLRRVRLDGRRGFIASLDHGWVTPVEPWGELHQVDGLFVAPDSRLPGEDEEAAANRLRESRWCEVREALPREGSQPALFICPQKPPL